jgi:hypothetical protein
VAAHLERLPQMKREFDRERLMAFRFPNPKRVKREEAETVELLSNQEYIKQRFLRLLSRPWCV